MADWQIPPQGKKFPDRANLVFETEEFDKADKLLEEAAETFRERHSVYGDNYKLVGAVMAALFPAGVKLETEDDHNRFHILLLEVVKLTRYTQNWGRGGHEDSQIDLAVYAAMLASIDREINSK